MSTAAVQVTASAGANPPVQVVNLYNIGDGAINPTVSVGASWLQAFVAPQAACPAAPVGCLPVNITFNVSSLPAGTYTAFILVSDPKAVDSPQTISVTVNLEAVPSTITLYAAPGGGLSTSTITPKSRVTTQPSTSGGGNWLSVSAQSTLLGAYYSYLVTATTQAGQGPGTYTGSIVVSGSNYAPDNKSVGVTLNVTTSPIARLSQSVANMSAPAGAQTSDYVAIANAGQGALSVSGATPTVTTGSGWLTATLASGGGAVTITGDATGLQPGLYEGSVALSTNAANNADLTIPVNFLVTNQVGPQIGFGGVVDNAVASGTVGLGDIAVAYGIQFTTTKPGGPKTLPLATSFNNVEITVNGVPAPLYFTSSGQIDFQIPYQAATGLAVVQVSNNGQLGNSVSVNVVARSPKILLFYGGLAPIIINYADGSVPVDNPAFTLLKSHPAHPGDTLIIYAIGLGQTDPFATTAAAATSSPLEVIDPPNQIVFGGGFTPSLAVKPLFTGLAPGYVGEYQINVTLPAGVPTGSASNGYAVPMMMNVEGATTNLVNVAIAPAGQN